MAIRDTQIHRSRRRLLVGSVALGAAGLAAAGVTLPTATASTEDKAPSPTKVVVCSSGIVTEGDVQTSSMVVTRVPAGEQPDIPGGCSVATG
jgi:hypothetical protein